MRAQERVEVIAAIGSVLGATALLVLPGAFLGLALRLRATVLWGAAPALTMGMIGAASIGYAKIGLPWTPPAVLTGMAIACLATGLIVRVLRARCSGRAGRGEPARVAGPEQWSRRASVLVVGTGIAACAISVAMILVATRGLEAVPQGWDSLLHGFAIRWIEQHEVASPFMLADVAHPADPHYYYPDAFHALAALGLQFPGMSLPAAYNALVAAVGPAFVLGSMALVRWIDPRPAAVASAGLLAASVGTFPVLMVHHGPLSPFALSMALIPGVLVAVCTVLHGSTVADTAGTAVAAGIAVSGMYVTHPSAALAGVVVLFLIGLAWVWGRVRVPAGPGSPPAGRFGAPLVGLVIVIVVAAVVTLPSVDLSAAGEMAGFDWPADETPLGAIGSAVSFPLASGRQWALTALLAAGCVAAFRNRSARGVPDRNRRIRPLVAAVVVFGAFYVVTASSDAGWVQTVTAPWWNDKYRFLGLMGAVSVPVLTAGLMLLSDAARWVLSPARRSPAGQGAPPSRAGRTGTVVTAAAMVVLTAVSAGVWAPRFTGVLRGLKYAGSPVVTAGEQDAYRWLADAYTGGTVMNDPYDGSPWLYTLEEVPVVIPGTLGADPETAMGPERMALYADMHSFGTSAAVDAAVEQFDVRWVLVGEGSVHGREKPPGFEGLDAVPGLRIAYETPDATIYRVLRG